MSKDACCHGRDARMRYLGDCSEQTPDGEKEEGDVCVHSNRWFIMDNYVGSNKRPRFESLKNPQLFQNAAARLFSRTMELTSPLVLTPCKT